MPGGSGEFRVTSWKLNKDFSIDIQGRTTTDSMYDLVAGPKPADVVPTPVPEENLYDTGVPGVVTGTPKLTDYGTYRRWTRWWCSRMLPATRTSWARTRSRSGCTTWTSWRPISGPASTRRSTQATDPATVDCTVNPDTARVFRVGDFVVFNDEAADANHAGRRSYECAQIVGPGSTGDVVPTGELPVPAGVPGVRSGLGHLRDAPLLRTWRAPSSTSSTRRRSRTRQEGILPDAGTAAARRGEDPLRLRRRGAGRRGEQLRLWAVHASFR